MSRATTARAAARTPVARRTAPVPPAARARAARPRRWIVAAVPLAAAAALGAAWNVLGADGHEHGPTNGSPASIVLRHIGDPRVAELDGGAGEATLHVVAEVRAAGTTFVGDAVPVGAPVTLTLETRAPDGGTAPTLSAELLTAAGQPADPAGATSLARHETFLYNRADGTFVLPQGAGTSSGALGHQHGASLTRDMPAGGFAWATTLGPRAGAVLTDPTGRWVAAAQPAAGRIDLVDLVARAGPLAAPVGGRPVALAFAPDGSTLWVANDGSGLVAVDLPGGDVHRVAGVGDAHAVAVSDDGREVLVIGTDGQARLVDAASRRVVAMRPASADVVATRFVGTLDGGAFVCVGRGGLVRVLPVRDGTFADDRAVETGAAGARDVGGTLVAPDGRTLLLSDRIADEIVVVDLVTGAVVRTVPAGADPAEIVRLEHFAVVRNAGAADATWVDLADTAQSNTVAIGGNPPSSLTEAPGGAEVLAAVPTEQRVFRVHVMNGHPMTMASDDDPVGADIAIDVVGALHAVEAGRYEQRTAFDTAGRYRLSLVIGGHRATWDIDVAAPEVAVVVSPLATRLEVRAGEPVTVTYAVAAGRTLVAPEVVAFAATASGPRQARTRATSTDDRTYTATLTFTTPGTYEVRLLDAASGVTAAASAATTVVVGA